METCKGSSNPADLLSRGTTPTDLIRDPLWLEVYSLHQVRVVYYLYKCENYSSLRRLLRVTAYVFKFIELLKSRSREVSRLTHQEIEAQVYWIRISQRSLTTRRVSLLNMEFSIWSFSRWRWAMEMWWQVGKHCKPLRVNRTPHIAQHQTLPNQVDCYRLSWNGQAWWSHRHSCSVTVKLLDHQGTQFHKEANLSVCCLPTNRRDSILTTQITSASRITSKWSTTLCYHWSRFCWSTVPQEFWR